MSSTLASPVPNSCCGGVKFDCHRTPRSLGFDPAFSTEPCSLLSDLPLHPLWHGWMSCLKLCLVSWIIAASPSKTALNSSESTWRGASSAVGNTSSIIAAILSAFVPGKHTWISSAISWPRLNLRCEKLKVLRNETTNDRVNNYFEN